jgi:hypothetical protein
MNNRKAFFSLFTFVLMLAVTLPMAHAAIGDEATQFTFSQPVAIPGQVLPAGTYLFALDDNSPNMVWIFNADRTKVYAALQTVPSIRARRNDNAAVTFAKRTSGQPDAIISWFYAGMLDGHQFLYPSQQERKLDADSKVVVTATPSEGTSGKDVSGK